MTLDGESGPAREGKTVCFSRLRRVGDRLPAPWQMTVGSSWGKELRQVCHILTELGDDALAAA